MEGFFRKAALTCMHVCLFQMQSKLLLTWVQTLHKLLYNDVGGICVVCKLVFSGNGLHECQRVLHIQYHGKNETFIVNGHIVILPFCLEGVEAQMWSLLVYVLVFEPQKAIYIHIGMSTQRMQNILRYHSVYRSQRTDRMENVFLWTNLEDHHHWQSLHHDRRRPASSGMHVIH